MRILVASYFFHPEGTPRATRTFELAKELARRGHGVDVFIPDYADDYRELEGRYGFHVRKVPAGFLLNKGDKGSGSLAAATLARPSILKRGIYECYKYFTGGRQIEYASTLGKALLSTEGRYDIVLSIGLPFAVHLGTAGYLRERGAGAAIAEYGDPYYYDPMERKFYVQRVIEAGVLRRFDRVTIPHDRILECFRPYRGVEKRIRILPQGFDIREIEREDYAVNAIPTLGYAGVFYRREGNPGELLEALVSSHGDFRFVVFTDTRPGSESMRCLAPYAARLGARLETRSRVSRSEVIKALSAMDFLVSMDWPGVFHSKLVDYKLSGRPILSYEPGRFERGTLDSFMNGDYSADFSPKIDLSAFDIRRVVDEFFAIADEAAKERAARAAR